MITTKMKQDIKNKWLQALQSGEFEQIDGRLTNGEGFCCLGVLCDLYIQETGKAVWNILQKFESDRVEEEMQLPEEVVEWSGLSTEIGSTCDPVVVVNDRNDTDPLSSLNDYGGTYREYRWNFLEIAEAIEKSIEGY